MCVSKCHTNHTTICQPFVYIFVCIFHNPGHNLLAHQKIERFTMIHDLPRRLDFIKIDMACIRLEFKISSVTHFQINDLANVENIKQIPLCQSPSALDSKNVADNQLL